MSYQLIKEASDLVNASKDPEMTRSLIKIGIQSLLHHQIIYRDSHTISSDVFDFLVENKGFFEKYFQTCGFDFAVSIKLSMVYVKFSEEDEEHYGGRLLRLKKDESLARLTIKHLYNNSFKSGNIDELGRVKCSFLDVINEYRKLTETEPPKETYFKNSIIRPLIKKGCLKMSSDDDITILPGINIVVSDAKLRSFLEKEQPTKEETGEIQDA